MKEKPHRLSKETYRGRISAAFTLCITDRVSAFADPDTVQHFTRALADTVQKGECSVPVYCFMPDHQHVLLTGTSDCSDILKTIGRYKQITGYWFSRNRPHLHWQKDFYDHIIRKHEDLRKQIRYILDNPVRKGLAASWRDYPFKGAIGCQIDDILNGIV